MPRNPKNMHNSATGKKNPKQWGKGKKIINHKKPKPTALKTKDKV